MASAAPVNPHPGSTEHLHERVRKQVLEIYRRHATLAAREASLHLHHRGLLEDEQSQRWSMATTHLRASSRTLAEVDPDGVLTHPWGHQLDQWVEQAASAFFAERLVLSPRQASLLLAQAVSEELARQVTDPQAPPGPSRP